MQKVLVTGVNGFVGKHLAAELFNHGIQTVGTGREATVDATIANKVSTYVSVDLTDEQAVKSIPLEGIDAIIHLAGLPSQAMSFAQPRRFVADNSAMFINLMEAALAQKLIPTPRFVVISTGAVYDSQQDMPLNESSKVAHNSPYVISKLLNEQLCDYYSKRGLECVVVRPFNHFGPGQLPGFILPDLTAQAIESIKNGTPMQVGNLKTKRDYTDVRDVVRAYVLLATAPKLSHRLYNVCSGATTSGEALLELIVHELGGTTPDIIIDASKIRPTDPPEIYGDHTRLSADTQWQPTYTLQQTIADYVQWQAEQSV